MRRAILSFSSHVTQAVGKLLAKQQHPVADYQEIQSHWLFLETWKTDGLGCGGSNFGWMFTSAMCEIGYFTDRLKVVSNFGELLTDGQNTNARIIQNTRSIRLACSPRFVRPRISHALFNFSPDITYYFLFVFFINYLTDCHCDK